MVITDAIWPSNAGFPDHSPSFDGGFWVFRLEKCKKVDQSGGKWRENTYVCLRGKMDNHYCHDFLHQ
jgi:hypothetical protein